MLEDDAFPDSEWQSKLSTGTEWHEAVTADCLHKWARVSKNYIMSFPVRFCEAVLMALKTSYIFVYDLKMWWKLCPSLRTCESESFYVAGEERSMPLCPYYSVSETPNVKVNTRARKILRLFWTSHTAGAEWLLHHLLTLQCSLQNRFFIPYLYLHLIQQYI